jgi:glycosyltransferase involved in cell wall biosynthesis
MMRISFVLHTNNFSGGLRVIALIAERLRDRGHEVLLLSQPYVAPSLRVIARKLLRQGRLQLRPRRPGPHLDKLADIHRALERPRPVTDADLPDADVVVATWWETAHWVAALSPSKGAKAYFMQDYGAAGQEIEKLVPTWRGPFAFITIAEWLRELILSYNPDAHVTVMRNAADLERFHAPPRDRASPPRVGYLHRAAKSKGADVALSAVAAARETVPELEVVAFGAEPQPDALPDFVDYRHRPTDAEVRAIYAGCDAWLFPSRIEGFGLPLLEAMACRTPVVASKAGAAPDLIRSGENGWLVDVDDVDAMARAIREMSTMPPDRWRALSEAAHATVAEYSWDDAVDIFEAALRDAAGLRRGS